MHFNKESGGEGVEQLLEELRQYEQQISNLTASIESQNEEHAGIEAGLMELIREKIGGSSSPPVPENNANGGEFSLNFGKLQDEIEATRQTLQVAHKNEVLAGTALARIATFITQHDEKYKHHLDGLREVIQRFQDVLGMSEEHNTRLKAELKMKACGNPLNGCVWTSGATQPQNCLVEKKLAPCYVEVTTTVNSLLNCMAAILDSFKVKNKLRLSNRSCLEEAHQRVRSQLVKQREVLTDVRHTVDKMERAISELQVENNDKKTMWEELQKELSELERSPSPSESTVATMEAMLRLPMEIDELKQALEGASKSTQTVQSVEKKTVEVANAQTFKLERATSALERARGAVAALEDEKAELQVQIEASRETTQKQLQQMEDEAQKVKELYEEGNEIKEVQRLLEAEAESLTASLDEARKRLTVLRAQLESKASQKAMLQDEKLETEENVNNLKNECVRARNKIIEIRKRLFALRQEEEKVSKDLEYITSLVPETALSSLPRVFTSQLEADVRRPEENLRQLVSWRDRNLFTKARQEHRCNVGAAGVPCAGSTPLDTVVELGANTRVLRRSSSSTTTQRPSRFIGDPAPSSTPSLDAHSSPVTTGREPRETALLGPNEEPPSGKTSQIVVDGTRYSLSHSRTSVFSPIRCEFRRDFLRSKIPCKTANRRNSGKAFGGVAGQFECKGNRRRQSSD
ncbi:uncharacterized protein Tco025E_03198 [Trypanosoma conorhini]|uniref:Uncharacterized protein n=1 Tax=Trypanosoma conorhini TaxID=83891 RepID=A0A3R7MXX1_9TRYP|nr:uncharacterized protein Tco025E_03198 [Trypanosoma conorhini]RNF22356.1 hypothetical protein Tco025E_03198 [Trypanosoma conorhini]